MSRALDKAREEVARLEADMPALRADIEGAQRRLLVAHTRLATLREVVMDLEADEPEAAQKTPLDAANGSAQAS